MATSMGLPAYLRLIAETVETAEAHTQPVEALRLIEILREELADQVSKRRAALPGAPMGAWSGALTDTDGG